MFFIDRQIFRTTVDLPRACEYNLQIAVVEPARFQNVELRRGIDIQIGHRIGHGIEMAGLAREIKKEPAALDQRGHRSGIANIGQIDNHAVADVVNVKRVAAVFRNQTVHQGDLCFEVDKASGEGRADETEASGNKDVRAGENLMIPGHRRIVGRLLKDFL